MPSSSNLVGGGLDKQQMHFQQQHFQQPPSNLMAPHRDDGSSGYDSPDSESFEKPASQ